MANELIHTSAGTTLTQAEFEAVGLHVLNSQATGDLIYASSATQLSRLGIGSTGQLLIVAGGIPSWTTTLTANIGIIAAATATNLLKVEKSQTITNNSSYMAGWFRNTMAKTSAVYTGIGYGIMGSFEIGATNTQNWTSVEDSVGVYGSAYIYAGATGTITELAGISALWVNASAMNVTSGYGLHVLTPENTGGGTVTTFYGLRIRDVTIAGTNYAIYTGAGRIHFGGALDKTYIGDTANTKMTLGLTINQAAAVNEVLAFKNSGVAHARTTLAEADTFGQMLPTTQYGGVTINAFVETGSAIGYQTQVMITSAANTTKTTAGRGALELNAYLINGDAEQNMTANGNLVQIGTYGGGAYVARFLFDAEGSGHADVEWTTYDTYSDIVLVKDMESELISSEYPAKTERRHQLESVGIIGQDSWHMENGKPRAMVNFTKLSMLHHGALIQLYDRIDNLEVENLKLQERVNLLLR